MSKSQKGGVNSPVLPEAPLSLLAVKHSLVKTSGAKTFSLWLILNKRVVALGHCRETEASPWASPQSYSGLKTN